MTTDRPYGDWAGAYRTAGWAGILPLGLGFKTPPPSGYTGRGGRDPDDAQIERWAEMLGASNIALRLPEGVAGIDVDAYGDKRGAETLAAAERKWGPLPPTWRSSSRPNDRISGIRLYRIPPNTVLAGKIELAPGGDVRGSEDGDSSDVEIVQHHHRYLVAPPSLHPERRPYQWYRPDGLPSPPGGPLPSPGELPGLPPAWLEGLQARHPSPQKAPTGAVFQLPNGRACQAVEGALSLGLADCAGGSRHDSVLVDVGRLVRLGEQKHHGVDPAVQTLRSVFVTAVAPDRDGGEREASEEFDRMLTGAFAIVAADPTPPERMGCNCGGGTVRRGEGTAEPAPAGQHVRRLLTVSLAEIEPRAVPWYWFGWIAKGALCVVTGHPEMGKSWLTYAISAYRTNGRRLPGDTEDHVPERVLLLGTEDALAFQVRPRLDSLSADVGMVQAVQGIEIDGKPGRFDLSTDLDALEAELRARSYGLVVISPLNGYLPKVNTHRDNDMHTVLDPLGHLAEKYDVAVIAIIHPTKMGQGVLPLYRIQGSVANSAACRTAILVGKDEEADGEGSPRRHIVLIKNNLIPEERKPKPLAFTLTQEDGFTWAGQSAATKEALLDGVPEVEKAKGRRIKAKEFLQSALADGPVEQDTLRERAEAEDIAWRTVERAKKELGVQSKPRGFRLPWIWWLPVSAKNAQSPPPPPHRKTGGDWQKLAETGQSRCPEGRRCSQPPSGRWECCNRPQEDDS